MAQAMAIRLKTLAVGVRLASDEPDPGRPDPGPAAPAPMESPSRESPSRSRRSVRPGARYPSGGIAVRRDRGPTREFVRADGDGRAAGQRRGSGWAVGDAPRIAPRAARRKAATASPGTGSDS